jgi:hypothetical protein
MIIIFILQIYSIFCIRGGHLVANWQSDKVVGVVYTSIIYGDLRIAMYITLSMYAGNC